jgi:hypothetical protein
MDSDYDTIFSMNIIEIKGKKSTHIAKEYGVSPARVRQYAKAHDLPYVSWDGGKTVDFYVFDEEAENEFVNRNRKSPGRKPIPRPPKVPGKPGRPRKEKPEDTGPKRPVGRPRKSPPEALDLVPKRPRGRPSKS